LKNISQWEGLSHILWKIKNVPNHQAVNVHFMLVPDIVLLQGSNLSAGSPKYAPSPLTYDACGMTSFRCSQLIQFCFSSFALELPTGLIFCCASWGLSVSHISCTWVCLKIGGVAGIAPNGHDNW